MEQILNHLWQSTLFAALAGLLTLALRRNRASTRHWLWFAASMKFLAPFALLVAAGSAVGWRSASVAQPYLQTGRTTVMDEVSQPFAAGSIVTTRPASSSADRIQAVVFLVWAIGFGAVVSRWWLRWRRVRAAVREASALNWPAGIEVRSSAALFEPGVFGIFRPVLLLPEGIAGRMTTAQLQAILAHEMCHVRRRDNLATAMHMVVEAVFWFHPLVWWLGARLVAERERACDEEVLRAGNDAETYAEGILKVCEFYLESPIECVAGVAGANLNERIEDIMANRMIFKLNAGRKLLLAGVGVLAVAGPVVIGLMNAPQIQAQSQQAKAVAFEVTSVKPHPPGDNNFGLPTFLPGGRFVSRYPLEIVISVAYNLNLLNPGARLTGVPEWARSREGIYDIEATGVIPAGLSEKARTDRMRSMLQTLLADRFKLKIHPEAKELPVYALVVGKGGPKLQKANIEEKDCPEGASTTALGTPPTACHSFMGGRGRGLHARAVDMADLVSYVENWTDRPLLDKTGIKGLYRIETKGWQPMDVGFTPAPGTKAEDGTDWTDVPTIYAIFEQFGLKMEAQKDRVDVYIVDHVEKPTEN